MLRFIFTFSIFIWSVTAYPQNHWEAIVLASDNWQYLPATSAPPSGWNQPVFDASSWQTGPGGIGYGDGDDATIIPAINSVYLLRTFQVNSLNDILECHLDVDYDDGFVAYLNGIEIARSSNVTETIPVFNSVLTDGHEAFMYQGGKPVRFIFETSMLQEGDNLLALQFINQGINSSDLTAIVFLNALVAGETLQYNETADYFLPPYGFSEGDLPIVKINTQGIEIPDEPKITATMGIIDNPNGLNQPTDAPNEYDGFIGIETRGSSSQMFEKKNYGLETRDSLGANNNVSLLGMPADNDWVLHGPYSDKSLMRNVLTFYLGNSMGRYAPRTRFCELFINENYTGVYVLMEKIKKDKNRVNIATLNPDEISGDDLTGGYILSIDRAEDFWISPYPGMNGWGEIVINYIYPDYADMPAVQRDYIRNYVTSFENTLNSSQFANPETGYAAYIDVASFIDYFLINELSKNVDAYRLSAFMYKDKDSKNGKLTMGPLWDFNLAFGNADYYDGWNTSGWMYESVAEGDYFQPPYWWERLLEDPLYRGQLKQRWNQLRAGVFSVNTIHNYIDSVADRINNAQQRNFETYPILDQYVWPNAFVGGSYPAEIEYLKSWISSRLTWMDSEIANFETINTLYENSLANNNISLYPNPFTTSTSLKFMLDNASPVTLHVYNYLGQLVFETKLEGHTGANEIEITASQLAYKNGLYLYTLNVGTGIKTSGRFVLQ